MVVHGVNVPQTFYPSASDGHLGCLQISATVNNAAVNIGAHVVFQISVSGLYGCISKSGFVGFKPLTFGAICYVKQLITQNMLYTVCGHVYVHLCREKNHICISFYICLYI